MPSEPDTDTNLATGGTGDLGHDLVKLLLRRQGRKVGLLARNPGRDTAVELDVRRYIDRRRPRRGVSRRSYRVAPLSIQKSSIARRVDPPSAGAATLTRRSTCHRAHQLAQ